jgi:hypothetical protein
LLGLGDTITTWPAFKKRGKKKFRYCEKWLLKLFTLKKTSKIVFYFSDWPDKFFYFFKNWLLRLCNMEKTFSSKLYLSQEKFCYYSIQFSQPTHINNWKKWIFRISIWPIWKVIFRVDQSEKSNCTIPKVSPFYFKKWLVCFCVWDFVCFFLLFQENKNLFPARRKKRDK